MNLEDHLKKEKNLQFDDEKILSSERELKLYIMTMALIWVC